MIVGGCACVVLGCVARLLVHLLLASYLLQLISSQAAAQQPPPAYRPAISHS